MRILIIGNTHCAKVFANYLADSDTDLVFTTIEGCDANYVDIAHYDIEELKEFALANEINLTILCDEKAVAEDFVKVFNDNNLAVIGPDMNSARIAMSKAYAKKFMYRNKIPTPKFGVFDKIQSAVEYARAQTFPLVVKAESHWGQNFEAKICETFARAKKAIETFFEFGVKNVVIENFIEGREFSLYIVTDGYNVVPVDYCAVYKNKFACIGANFINESIKEKAMQKAVIPTVAALGRMKEHYIGILGFDFILDKKDNLYLLEYNTFFKDLDAELFLASLQENLPEILNCAIVGTLIDNFKCMTCANMNFMALKGMREYLTVYGRTLNEAKERLLEEEFVEELVKWNP
jgi:phosphoribosylamine-glycine ligase